MPAIVFGQKTITGTVTDAATNETLIGVNILIVGTTTGTITDYEGKYSLSVPAEATEIQFSYTGYQPQTFTVGSSSQIDVKLSAGELLEEVVVIGYGTVSRDDATGSVIGITEEELNKGFIASPQDLLIGKAAGVNITTNGGAPGSGSQIRIRGGSSLDASNDPLIIVDGVPLDNGSIAGSRNIFDFINPSDIASFSILKDASATAIYGSRASNGVIIITTKKGEKGDLKFTFNSSASYNTARNSVNVLSADQFRTAINERVPQRADELGSANTNWQDQIFQDAFGFDNNFSVRGAVKDIPFRASVGFTQQDGILKTEALQRTTGSLSLTPTFLDNKLKVELNARGSLIKNNFADVGAIGSALTFDPTQPVFDAGLPGGFFDYYEADGTATTNTVSNPLALLELRDNQADLSRFVGNIKLDYQLPFAPGLTTTLNLGLDRSNSDGVDFRPATLAAELITEGSTVEYGQDENNQLLDFYLTYAKDLESINARLDLTGGYSYQNFYEDRFTNITRGDGIGGTVSVTDILETNLQSFFGRANFSLNQKYLFTFTYRRDGSSRFGGDNRWGNFPAAAVAWNISKEGFLSNSNNLSNLKLRLGWGITGQQDVLQGNDTQPYLAQFAPNQAGGAIQIGQDENGNPIFVETFRAQPFDANIKWEETTTYNLGLDFAFFDYRLSGALELYYRETEDLLSTVNVAAGSNLTNRLPTNIGSLTNQGVELFLDAVLVQKEDFTWNLGFNYAYNENEVDRLFLNNNDAGSGIPVPGTQLVGIGGDNGAQYHIVGEPTRSYFSFVQVYDNNGNPIEGAVVDLNGDGMIDDADRRAYRQPAPLINIGLNSRINWKAWDFSFSMRSSIGSYNYNAVDLLNGNYGNLSIGQDLRNVTSTVLNTNFETDRNELVFSDYFVQEASFLRLDNMSLGYTFKDLLKGGISRLRLYSTVQNLFVITDYEGLDPEVVNGIDNNIFPRPFVAQFGVSIDF